MTATVKKAGAQLKDLNISWDLKNNKTVTYKTYFRGDSSPFYKSGKVTIKNYKITKAKKKGYKKLSFDIEFTRPTNFKKSQIEDVLAHYYDATYGRSKRQAKKLNYMLGNNLYWTVVDYESGECLEKKIRSMLNTNPK